MGGLIACGADSNTAKPIDFNPNGFEGFESQTFGLLAANCTIATAGTPAVTTMTVLVGADETAYVFKRASDGMVVVNGQQADGSECKVATTATLVFNASDLEAANNTDQKVIVDYYGGLFATATAASTLSATPVIKALIQVDLGGGTGDQLSIRGTPNSDYVMLGTQSGYDYVTFAMGANATATAAVRTIHDIVSEGAETIAVSTGPGMDIINGLGIGGLPTTVALNPQILRGDISMVVYGGDGNDTITSGNVSSGGASNALYGNNGADRFIQQKALAKDLIDGGGSGDVTLLDNDIVDYGNRANSVCVSLAAGTAAMAPAGSLTVVDKASLSNHDGFTLTDGTNSESFEYRVVNGSDTPATGTITVDAVNYDNVTEGDFITLVDANDLSVTYGFTTTSTYDPTIAAPTGIGADYAIDLTAVFAGAHTADDIAAAIQAQLAATKVASGLDLTASVLNNVVTLTSDTAGDIGTKTFTLTATGGSITKSNLTGGVTFWVQAADNVIDVRTLHANTTATEIAYLTAIAINNIGAGLLVTATTPITATMVLTKDTAGAAGTESITVTGLPLTRVNFTGAAAAVNGALNDGECNVTTKVSAEMDTIVNVAHVIGSAGADYLDASASNVNHILLGGAGDDTLIGAGLSDFLYGGQGNDTLRGGGGKDTLAGGDADDVLQGGAADDKIDGGGLNCPVLTQTVPDVAPGSPSALLAVQSPACVAATAPLIGSNTMDFSDRIASEGVHCKLSETNLTTATSNSNRCGVLGEADLWWNIRNLRGGAGDDGLYGDANANSIWGGDGSDTLSGMAGNDSLYGEGGNDTIYGGGAGLGEDAGDGNDFISGGVGYDSIYGQDGNDLLDAMDGMPDVQITCGGNDADVGVTDGREDSILTCGAL